jgi:hypothetical protein
MRHPRPAAASAIQSQAEAEHALASNEELGRDRAASSVLIAFVMVFSGVG